MMAGLAIFLIFWLTVVMACPKCVGSWLAEVRVAYDRHRLVAASRTKGGKNG